MSIPSVRRVLTKLGVRLAPTGKAPKPPLWGAVDYRLGPKGLPGHVLAGSTMSFWKRVYRRMPKRGWAKLNGYGVTTGGGIVFQAVKKEG